MDEMYASMSKKLEEYAKKINYAADTYQSTDEQLGKWYLIQGRMNFGVPGGEFTYVNQDINIGDWAVGQNKEYACNIASWTMAMNSIGFDETKASEVYVKNGGVLVDYNKLAEVYGINHSTGKTEDLLNNYLAHPGEYSAPVIKIPGPLGTHFMVVIGKNPDGTYIVVDPYNQEQTSVNPRVIEYAYQLSKI
jgi:hypothetical protein